MSLDVNHFFFLYIINRTDGLSGSVSSANGEVGILGVGTVVKGEDKVSCF